MSRGLAKRDCLDLVRLVDNCLSVAHTLVPSSVDLARYIDLRDRLFDQYDLAEREA